MIEERGNNKKKNNFKKIQAALVFFLVNKPCFVSVLKMKKQLSRPRLEINVSVLVAKVLFSWTVIFREISREQQNWALKG